MRKFGLSVIGAAVFALWAPSLAQASDTLTLGVTSNYVLQDLGIEASRNPGIILDRLHTSGNWTLEWWQRVDLGGGVYGNRGFGDEHDFSLTSDWLVSTFFGQMRLEVSGAYYALAPLFSTRNDIMQFYADAGFPIDMGWGSVTPAARLIEIVGVTNMPNLTMTRLRMPISVPVSPSVTFVVEPAVTWNFTPQVGNIASPCARPDRWCGR